MKWYLVYTFTEVLCWIQKKKNRKEKHIYKYKSVSSCSQEICFKCGICFQKLMVLYCWSLRSDVFLSLSFFFLLLLCLSLSFNLVLLAPSFTDISVKLVFRETILVIIFILGQHHLSLDNAYEYCEREV